MPDPDWHEPEHLLWGEFERWLGSRPVEPIGYEAEGFWCIWKDAYEATLRYQEEEGRKEIYDG